jgi:hypothetical protein
MRPSVKVALIFVGIWFLGKMSFFWFQFFQEPDGVKFMVMWNILCLLLGMTIGTLLEIKNEDRSQSTALGDIKKAMTGGMLYAVLVSSLLYVYYAKIDPGFNKQQIETGMENDKKYISNPKNLAKIKEDPQYESKSTEEILRERLDSYKEAYSAGTTMTMSLLGLMVLCTINAIVVTVVFRRVLFKQRTL